MNPCRAGGMGDPSALPLPAPRAGALSRRVSGPLLDRIDLRVVMPRLAPAALVDTAPAESSSVRGPAPGAWTLLGAQRRRPKRRSAGSA